MVKHINKKKAKRSKSNKSKIILIITIIVAQIFYSSRESISSIFMDNITYEGHINDIELPKIKDSTHFIYNDNGRFSYLYSPEDKQSHWVAYRLTKNDLNNTRKKRENNFRPDPIVIKNNWKSAEKDDYYKTIFDRGHLLPSADRNESKSENQSTFIFSNIAPQRTRLNRGGWMNLESQIRDWVEMYDTLYIATGGVLNDKKMGHIGKNKVSIPHQFYKVILSKKDNLFNAIGFVMPNSTDAKNDFMQYKMSVNDVEEITKLDFFDNLPNKIERKVEKSYNTFFWKQTKTTTKKHHSK